jgi:NRAMP (natural resistance-associated macrophage protein)-like metal ion transporter
MGRLRSTPTVDPREGRVTTRAQRIARERDPAKKAALLLGPGFITGAADDDPSGLATYSVAGATFGLQTLWTAVITFPFMAAVQNVCSRIGIVSGKGLAGVLKEHFPRWVLYPAVAIVVVANTVNVGADLGAIADAVGLLTGAKGQWVVIPVAAAILAVQVFGSYRLIERLFKWLTLALVAYVVDAVIVRPPLGDTLRATLVPTFSADPGYIATIVAILGTTISPYLFFWQASQEVEEKRVARGGKPKRRIGAGSLEISIATIDVNVGMFVSNLVMYFVILSTGLTLHASGRTEIGTAADAAEALRPLAGDLAGAIFAIGMIGTGLLAVPVLSGAAAYAVSETFGWREGLDEDWRRAKPFYGVVAASTIVGVLIPFTGIRPVDALFVTAVLNGIAAPPLLVVIMLAARDRRVMGAQTIGPVLTGLGWVVTVAMFLALVGLAVTSLAASGS